MKMDTIRKFILPPGPILSMTLIGLLFLSATIYYRAVKIQRFLEPALAVSQPRLKFTQSINKLISEEFGPDRMAGVRFRAGTIIIEESLLFRSSHGAREPEVLKKLGRVFLGALADPAVKENISLILVSTRLPVGPDSGFNRSLRTQFQAGAVSILNALYAAAPELEKSYSGYFAATAVPVNHRVTELNWVEFRIVPTERLHIEVLQRLEKYMQ